MNSYNLNGFPKCDEWLQSGSFAKILGYDLYYQDSQKGNETICFLHGFPTSSYDFWKVLPTFSKTYRTVIHDHLGFGFSHKPVNHHYSLFDQADRAVALWESLGLTEIHLIAHDYGTSVATELIARQNQGKLPIEIHSLTLCNGSILINMADLRWIQILLRNQTIGFLFAKLSNHPFYNLQMRRLWFDKSKYDQLEMLENWKIMNHNKGKHVVSKVSYYLTERKEYLNYWLTALKEMTIPCHILWAQDDPVSLKDIAEKLHEEIPNSLYTKMPNSGHYPMLESPEIWINHHLAFLNNLDDYFCGQINKI